MLTYGIFYFQISKRHLFEYSSNTCDVYTVCVFLLLCSCTVLCIGAGLCRSPIRILVLSTSTYIRGLIPDLLTFHILCLMNILKTICMAQCDKVCAHERSLERRRCLYLYYNYVTKSQSRTRITKTNMLVSLLVTTVRQELWSRVMATLISSGGKCIEQQRRPQ